MAAAITYFATPFVRSLAVATGAFTAVRERDVHTTPIPRLGGVGIYIGFVAAALVARQLPYLGTLFSDRRDLGRPRSAAAIVCLVGAFDDIRELDWLTKLAGQMLAAGPDGLHGRPAAVAADLRDDDPAGAGARGLHRHRRARRRPTR